MSLLSLFAGMPEVHSAVVGDTSGELSESLGEIDGESVSAVMAFVVSMFRETGQNAGLGALQKINLKGKSSSCVVAIREEAIVTVVTDPTKATTEVEKKLETSEWVKAGDMMILLQEEDLDEEGTKTKVDPILGKEGTDFTDPF